MTNDLHELLKGQTILVIDDEPDSLEIAETLLEDFEVQVLKARNGKEGLDIASNHLPSFIISDLSMPVMSGWELIEQLKKDRRTMEIPVIALTAHAMVGDRQKAISAGFHNYLSKPLNPDTFVKDLLRVVMDTAQFIELMNQANSE